MAKRPIEELEEEDDDSTPAWARRLLEKLTDRVEALEKGKDNGNADDKQESAGEAAKDEPKERKPKRSGFLAAWDRDD